MEDCVCHAGQVRVYSGHLFYYSVGISLRCRRGAAIIVLSNPPTKLLNLLGLNRLHVYIEIG